MPCGACDGLCLHYVAQARVRASVTGAVARACGHPDILYTQPRINLNMTPAEHDARHHVRSRYTPRSRGPQPTARQGDIARGITRRISRRHNATAFIQLLQFCRSRCSSCITSYTVSSKLVAAPWHRASSLCPREPALARHPYKAVSAPVYRAAYRARWRCTADRCSALADAPSGRRTSRLPTIAAGRTL